MRVTKVAVLTNRIPDYRFPVFDALRNDVNLELKIFLSLPEHRSAEKARKALNLHYSKGFNLTYRTVHREPGVAQQESLPVPVMLPFDLYRYRPDIIITGEFGLRSLAGWLVARAREVPLAIWSEEINETARGINPLQQNIRRFLIPKADAFLAWGEPASRYLRSWKVDENRIYRCAQAVDNGLWGSLSDRDERQKAREKIAGSGKIFLAVGQLIARKGFDLFLKAWGRLPERLKTNNRVVIVGSGEEEQNLKKIVVEHCIPNVHFVSHQEPRALASFYAAADALVFPSLVDVWGMVVNEAMACGVPVLASRYAGASQELIDGTGAGELIDPLDVEAFSKALERWCSADLSRMQTRARVVIEDHNFGVTVIAIRRLIHDFCRHHELTGM